LENDAEEKKVDEKSRRTLYRKLALEREANAELEAEKKELETACRNKDDIIAAQDLEIEELVWQIDNVYSEVADDEVAQSLILCREDLENPEFLGYPNRVKFCFVQLMSLGISGDVAHKGARIILDAYAPHLPEDLEVPRPSTLDGWRESSARAGRVCAGVHAGNPAVTKIMHGEDGSTKENLKVATSVLTLLTGHGKGSFRHFIRTAPSTTGTHTHTAHTHTHTHTHIHTHTHTRTHTHTHAHTHTHTRIHEHTYPHIYRTQARVGRRLGTA
jgi:hypothetical protein